VTINDILSSSLLLLDNPSEEELNFAVALEVLASVLNIMRQEQILGALDDIIKKAEVTFTGTTGIVTNSLTEFGDVVYLEFNGEAVNECPVGMLSMAKDAGLLRVAFWKDDDTGTKKIELSIPQEGTLKVWYEPDVTDGVALSDTIDHSDSLRMCIASRHALACIAYVHFKSEIKEIGKQVLYESLKAQAAKWTEIYLDRVNRIGLNRPFTRLPFMADIRING
jgi:hypothetical protein